MSYTVPNNAKIFIDEECLSVFYLSKKIHLQLLISLLYSSIHHAIKKNKNDWNDGKVLMNLQILMPCTANKHSI